MNEMIWYAIGIPMKHIYSILTELLTVLNPSNATITFVQSTRMQRFLTNHIIPVMLVFIGKLSQSTLRGVSCARVSFIFSVFLHHFVIGSN